MADDSVWALTVTLSEPIELKNKTTGDVIETIPELPFRKPSAMDIIEVGGNPVLMDMYADDPMSTLRFDGKQMSAMMARLSGKPMSTIARMSPADWTHCAWSLSGFFLPARPTASSASV
jgi:hypothetical protein